MALSGQPTPVGGLDGPYRGPTMALLKDEINTEVVERLATAFEAAERTFDGNEFRRLVTEGLAERELKDRVNLIADTLAEMLPADYRTALAIVIEVAATDVGPWAAWPLCSLVERHGLLHPEASLAAMATLTPYWSCEFAIRPYLEQHLELTRQHLRRWVLDPSEHVRRLPSEGTRPLLPWGPKVAALIDDPGIGLEVLHELRHDPSETVRRSVANHLNDLSRFDADLVVEVLGSWIAENGGVDDKMVRHALRTLVKNGHPGALELLGFTADPKLSVAHFGCLPDRIVLGERIELTAVLVSTAEIEQQLVVDFVIHHLNASGASSPKVFKWTTGPIGPGATIELVKRRTIQSATTRTYHPGRHRVELQVGGRILASTQFELVTAA